MQLTCGCIGARWLCGEQPTIETFKPQQAPEQSSNRVIESRNLWWRPVSLIPSARMNAKSPSPTSSFRRPVLALLPTFALLVTRFWSTMRRPSDASSSATIVNGYSAELMHNLLTPFGICTVFLLWWPTQVAFACVIVPQVLRNSADESVGRCQKPRQDEPAYLKKLPVCNRLQGMLHGGNLSSEALLSIHHANSAS